MIGHLVDRLLTYMELKRADRFAREQASLQNIEVCTDERCTISAYHPHCRFQTALAAQRNRERKR